MVIPNVILTLTPKELPGSTVRVNNSINFVFQARKILKQVEARHRPEEKVIHEDL